MAVGWSSHLPAWGLRVLALTGAMALLPLVALPPDVAAGPVAAGGRASCPVPLAAASSGAVAGIGGSKAAGALGGDLPAAAQANGMSAATFRRILTTDATARLDRCARMFFVDPPPARGSATGSARPATTAAPTPGARGSALDDSPDAFALSSRPGSSRTLYLDFDGAWIGGTAWIQSYVGASGTMVPFDMDGDPTTFGPIEQMAIKEVWLRVAEDYAPFDINVTTHVPDPAALARSDISDQVYGVTAVVTNDTTIQSLCACGGIAYLGAIDRIGTEHEVEQPALVFAGGTAYQAKAIAEAASHEVGHNFGLSHDGDPTHAYHGSYPHPWAPIMGQSNSAPVSQWSKGEYAGATNREDDLATIARNAPLLPDDVGNDAASATPLASRTTVDAIISSATDSDWFSFVSDGGAVSVSVVPQAVGANLDTRLDVFDSAGRPVDTSNPLAPDPITSQESTTGLDAGLYWPGLAAGTYYAKVCGTGQGDAAGTGYSSYASVGRYQVEFAQADLWALRVATASLPRAMAGRAYSTQLTVAGGRDLATSWTVSDGALPDGLVLSQSGLLSGTPTTVAQAADITVAATQSGSGRSATAALSIEVLPVLWIDTEHVHVVPGSPANVTLSASGGNGQYVWEQTYPSSSSYSLPAGLTLAPDGTITGYTFATGTFDVWVTVHMPGSSYVASRGLWLYLVDSPSIVTASLPSVLEGTDYDLTLKATGGAGWPSWTVTAGSLPCCLRLDATTGHLSGQAATPGRFPVQITYTDQVGSARAAYTLEVRSALAISTASLPAANVQQAYSAAVATTGGGATKSFRVVVGSLPPGLGLDPSTGVIHGTPTQAGVTSFTIDCTDSMATVRAVLRLTVDPVLSILTSSLPPGTEGQGYATAIAAAGWATTPHFRIASGSLPPGLVLDGATGSVHGIPTASGSFWVTVVVEDLAYGVQASRDLVVDVTGPVQVFGRALAEGMRGRPYSDRVGLFGGKLPYRLAVLSGRLPRGLTLSDTGGLSGTPDESGEFTFVVAAADAVGRTGRGTFSLRVGEPVTLVASTLPDALRGRAYSASVSASGGLAPYGFGSVGPMPPGLWVDGQGNLRGTPTHPGTFHFWLSVVDARSSAATAEFVLRVLDPPILVTTAALAEGTVGARSSWNLAASGGTGAFLWRISAGALPPGVSLGSQGQLAGVPARAGTFTVKVESRDAYGQAGNRGLMLVIRLPVRVVTSPSLAAAVLGHAYALTLRAAGGTGRYTWTRVRGSLPRGVTLSAGGRLAGIARTRGTYVLVVRVTDSGRRTATSRLTLRVR